jgi:hypothetical protein
MRHKNFGHADKIQQRFPAKWLRHEYEAAQRQPNKSFPHLSKVDWLSSAQVVCGVQHKNPTIVTARSGCKWLNHSINGAIPPGLLLEFFTRSPLFHATI